MLESEIYKFEEFCIVAYVKIFVNVNIKNTLAVHRFECQKTTGAWFDEIKPDNSSDKNYEFNEVYDLFSPYLSQI